MNHLLKLALVLALLLPVTNAWGLSKEGRKEAKSMLKGTLYLRMDAPCATGRHSFGVYKRPLVEVSPEGSNTDTDTTLTASWWHADSTYWGIRINDSVKVEEVDFDDAEVDIEFEGVKEAEDKASVVRFVNIRTLDDFKKAFDQTFSTQPLQDLHDDWSDEIKEAVGERELKNGMSKRQAFYITGSPKSFEKKNEDGNEVEIWHLRQDNGMKMGYFRAKAGEKSGLPSSLRFENGKLVDPSKPGTSSDFSLDN
jgi:flagellar basal body rod protein FlgC